jgi:hypothetical protein
VSGVAVGIDLGTRHVDVVRLGGRDADWVRLPAADTAALVAHVAGAAAIGVDAPAAMSVAAHRDDPAVNRKFRTARCGEIALGEQAGIWVPWVTPPDPATVPAWMAVGFAVWAALRDAGHEPVEVYPAGAFLVLAGTRLPRKTTAAGRETRRRVLATRLDLPGAATGWPHDALDAAAAALTAADLAAGTGRRCGHDAPGCDGSAVWLPVSP